jgi:hypothetical protein
MTNGSLNFRRERYRSLSHRRLAGAADDIEKAIRVTVEEATLKWGVGRGALPHIRGAVHVAHWCMHQVGFQVELSGKWRSIKAASIFYLRGPRDNS